MELPLNYLSNFQRSLDMPLIKGTLTLTWSENCVITSMEKRAITNTQTDPSPTNAIFKIKDTNLYIPIVTLSTKDDNNF